MRNDNYIDFAYLWKGEQRVLSRLAASVPERGTIVEIGTAEGGTAMLMYQATQNKGVQIHTVDIEPSPKALGNLVDTDVTLVTRASSEYARTWNQTIGRPIDFLFIDGGHDLKHVVEDFNLWVPNLKPGGLVAFHDYDPAERGGQVHLAVKVCIDSILEAGFLQEPSHEYKLLSGKIEEPDKVHVDARACYDSLVRLADRVLQVKDSDHRGEYLVADDRFAVLLQGCLLAGDELEVRLPTEVTDPSNRYLVSAHPTGLPLEVLRGRGIPDTQITTIDSVTACYLVAGALRSNFSHLVASTSSPSELFFWAETLSMFEHAFGDSPFPDSMPQFSDGLDIVQVSQLVAREQVRLTILARILRTFVDWTP